MRASLWMGLLGLMIVAGPSFAEENSEGGIQAIQLAPAATTQQMLQQIDAWEKKLQTTKARIDVIEAPLTDALTVLSEQTEIPIRIDVRALDDVGLSGDMPITFHSPEMTTETALKLLLREVVLTFRVDSSGVVVTTQEESERSLRLKFYPVDDLSGNDTAEGFDQLRDLIITCIEPPSWEDLGGPGTIRRFQNGLLVNQRYEIHRMLEGLLTQLREMKQQPGEKYSTASRSVFPDEDRAEKVEAQLKSTQIPIDFIETPLQEVVEYLSHVGHVPIHVARGSLDEIGMSVDQPISLTLNKVSLKEALDVITKQYDLSWYIVGEMIIITTHEEAESELEIRVYPVRDIVWHGLNITDPETRTFLQEHTMTLWDRFPTPLGNRSEKTPELPRMPDYDDLLETITSTVEPESWEKLGGPGSIAELPSCDVIVVQQTREEHEQVAQLLHLIRLHRSQADAQQLEQQIRQLADETISIRYEAYPASDSGKTYSKGDLEAIGRQLQRTVESTSWELPNHSVIATESGLLVRHRRETQRQILSFLNEIGIGLPKPYAGDLDSNEPLPEKVRGGMGPGGFSAPPDVEHGGFF